MRELIELYSEHQEIIIVTIITSIISTTIGIVIGTILEKMLNVTKIPIVIYKYIFKKKMDNKQMMQHAIDEIYPMLEELEIILGEMENHIIQASMVEYSLNAKEYDEQLEELIKVKKEIQKYSKKIKKPKNLRRRLERKTKGKIKKLKYYEEVYFIHDMMDVIEFLSYGLFAKLEENTGINDELDNLEVEINKAIDSIGTFMRKYKEYTIKYTV